MNLVNYINSSKMTSKEICIDYNKDVVNCIEKFRRKGLPLSKEAFEEFEAQEDLMDGMTYEGFSKVIRIVNSFVKYRDQLSKWEEGKMLNDLIKITNGALAEKFAKDMMSPECNEIKLENYEFLSNLCTSADREPTLPKIVKGNLEIYKKREKIEQNKKGYAEGIDRMERFLLAGKPDDMDVERYLMGGDPINKVRESLNTFGKNRYKFSKSGYMIRFEKSVWGVIKKLPEEKDELAEYKKELVRGEHEVSEETYEYILKSGEARQTDSAIIKSGTELYKLLYISREEQREYIKKTIELLDDVRLYDCADVKLKKVPYYKTTMEGVSDLARFYRKGFKCLAGKGSLEEFDYVLDYGPLRDPFYDIHKAGIAGIPQNAPQEYDEFVPENLKDKMKEYDARKREEKKKEKRER